jgi:hypothetical protein
VTTIGVLRTSVQYRLEKWGKRHYAIFDPKGRGLASADPQYYTDATDCSVPAAD